MNIETLLEERGCQPVSGWYQQAEIFSNFNQRNGCLGDDVGELLFRGIMLLDAFLKCSLKLH